MRYLRSYSLDVRHEPSAKPRRSFAVVERVVGCDNCVRFNGFTPQIPPDRHRCHSIKAKIKDRQHMDGTISISHGPRHLARYATNGKVLTNELLAAA